MQRVFQEFNDPAVLLTDAAIHEPLAKSYLGEPDNAFQERHLPVAHYGQLGPEVLDAATRAQLVKHSNVVFVVHGHPRNAQLVAQCIVEIKRYVPCQPVL